MKMEYRYQCPICEGETRRPEEYDEHLASHGEKGLRRLEEEGEFQFRKRIT